MPTPLRRTLERTLERLRLLKRPDGTFEGNLESGLIFNATAIIVSRYYRLTRTDAAERRELGLARYMLSQQDGSGAFASYPGGPLSLDVTRLTVCVLRRVLASNTLLTRDAQLAPERVRLVLAEQRASVAVARGPQRGFREIPFQTAYFHFLSTIDSWLLPTTGDRPQRTFPNLPNVVMAWLIDSPLWGLLNGVSFPFLTAVLPVLTIIGSELTASTGWGRRAIALLRGVPGLDYLERVRASKERLVAHIISWQDGNGAFFYSNAFTELLVLALEAARDDVRAPALQVALEAALERGKAYLASHEVVLDEGIYVRHLGSDVWDSLAVAMSALGGKVPAVGEDVLGGVLALALSDQTAEGGWSFGSTSSFADNDSTGLAVAYLAELRVRGLFPERAEEVDRALGRGLRFLADHQSLGGGFRGWGKSYLPKPVGPLSEVGSLLFDLPTEDLTGRVLFGLGRVRALLDSGKPHGLHPSVIARLEPMARRAFGFLARHQVPGSGLWPSRWSLGFISGTAFVLVGVRDWPFEGREGMRLAAAATLLASANPDGGFGESERSEMSGYFETGPSTAAQTVWALVALREAGVDRQHPVYRRALDYLVAAQAPDGTWPEASLYTNFTGFYYRYELMSLASAVLLLLAEVEA